LDFLGNCPGFGQDRVNFHQTPGRDTAGWADPTWPNRVGYSIPCAVMLGSGGREQGGGNSLAAREHAAAAVVESGSVVRSVLFSVFPLSVSLLLLFPLFAVMLNCPYPYPPVSACFFPFSSTPRRGEGQPRGAFVAGRSQTRTGMKTRKKEEMGMLTFLPFVLGALRSSSTAGWDNVPFKTPPALISNAFAPTPFLWPPLSSPNLGALTELPCWIYNLLCISTAAHALLKHHSQRGRGKTFAFEILVCKSLLHSSMPGEKI